IRPPITLADETSLLVTVVCLISFTPSSSTSCAFFFTDTATPVIYTLSLHDALPICLRRSFSLMASAIYKQEETAREICERISLRSEEHTSELQSRFDLVCRLLLEKKKTIAIYNEAKEECKMNDISVANGNDDDSTHV